MLSDHQRHGEAGSTSPKSAQEERLRIRGLLEEKDPEFIFNCDETAFFWKSSETHGLSMKHIPGKKMDKSQVSVMVTMNATGTRKIHLLFIGSAAKPRCFKKKMGLELGFWYFHNKKAWMTGEIFAQAMEDLDKEFREEGIHVTMLLDNFSGHKWREDKITNITFIFFSPNLTPHVQPADAGIIRNLKAKYGELRLVRSLDREEAGEEDIFAIDLLQAMHLLAEAWDAVKPETIQACWRHTGILPSTGLVASIEPVPEVEAEVADAAKVLQNLNAAIMSRSGQCAHLCKPTLIDNIEVLLAEPTPPIWPVEDNDIKDLIAAVKEPAEDDHDMPVKEVPSATRKEVLAAMQLLLHIAINRRNEQEFLQLSRSLSLVSDTLRKEAYEQRSTTLITDFFSSVPNPKSTATDVMETDGSAILVSDSEPEVLDGDYSHLQSLQEGLTMTMEVAQSDDGRSWISVDD